MVFDETIHGFDRVPGLLAESLRFPLVLGVLQSLLLLAVVLWAGMGRFGKPLPAAPALAAGKEVLIDNTAKLLVTGGHAGDSLLRYFRQTTRTVAAHYVLLAGAGRRRAAGAAPAADRQPRVEAEPRRAGAGDRRAAAGQARRGAGGAAGETAP